jgi:transcriptional regulator with XRE-family HTH domain
MDGNRNRATRLWTSRQRARELGERVKTRRKALGLSQEQLGQRCGLHRTYIGLVERGDVNLTVRNLLAVADGLGIDVGELVRGLRRAG